MFELHAMHFKIVRTILSPLRFKLYIEVSNCRMGHNGICNASLLCHKESFFKIRLCLFSFKRTVFKSKFDLVTLQKIPRQVNTNH